MSVCVGLPRLHVKKTYGASAFAHGERRGHDTYDRTYDASDCRSIEPRQRLGAASFLDPAPFITHSTLRRRLSESAFNNNFRLQLFFFFLYIHIYIYSQKYTYTRAETPTNPHGDNIRGDGRRGEAARRCGKRSCGKRVKCAGQNGTRIMDNIPRGCRTGKCDCRSVSFSSVVFFFFCLSQTCRRDRVNVIRLRWTLHADGTFRGVNCTRTTLPKLKA